MKGNEFLKKIKALAKRKGWDYAWYPDQGKGSHGILRVDNKLTVVRNPKDELKKGTLQGMLKQLDIKESELYKR